MTAQLLKNLLCSCALVTRFTDTDVDPVDEKMRNWDQHRTRKSETSDREVLTPACRCGAPESIKECVGRGKSVSKACSVAVEHDNSIAPLSLPVANTQKSEITQSATPQSDAPDWTICCIAVGCSGACPFLAPLPFRYRPGALRRVATSDSVTKLPNSCVCCSG